jgi:hypothetical protein
MRFWHKFVSAGVLATLVLLPFVSLAMCAPQSSGAMHCPEGCPMMAKMKAKQQREIQLRADKSSSCCEISSSKPVPATQATIVAPVVSIAPPPATTAPLAAVPAQVIQAVDTSPPGLAASQSLLCTFRI